MYKVLILVPHPDDEINVAGNLFPLFREIKANVTVAIVTNGDYNPSITRRRQYEAFKAKQILKYDNLVYLGYGDGYKGKHLYHTDGNTIVESNAGFLSTYNVSEKCPSYHFFKYGEQVKYTRNNLKSDLKDLILDSFADLIVCVDNDKHPEHRCVSLLFDEVIGELIKCHDYHPYILKAFAYIGVYDSVRDYFHRPIFCTLPAYQGKQVAESCVFPYLWKERIRVKVPNGNLNMLFWKSPIFKALLAHYSQRAACRFDQILNADSVYFQRRTDSLTYTAKVNVSSGDKSYLNDFKIVDYDNICDSKWEELGSLSHCWHPKLDDVQPYIKYAFKKKQTLKEIVIYQNKESKISNIRVMSDGGYDRIVKVDDCYKVSIKFDVGIEATVLNLFFIGENIQINEIELYENNAEDILKKFCLPEYFDKQKYLASKISVKCQLLKGVFFLFKIIYIDKKQYFKRIKFKLLQKK